MHRLLILLTLGLGPGIVSAQQLARADLTMWLARYEEAWESRDPASASALFTEDALYYETPYSEPLRGRDGIAAYWADVTADQRDVDFEAEVLSVDAGTGIAHWTAVFTLASTGAEVALDGVFVLEFDTQGLVTELREWWVLRP